MYSYSKWFKNIIKYLEHNNRKKNYKYQIHFYFINIIIKIKIIKIKG